MTAVLPSSSGSASIGYPASDRWIGAIGSLHAQPSLPFRPDPPCMSPSTRALRPAAASALPSSINIAHDPFMAHELPSRGQMFSSPGGVTDACACGNSLMPDSRFCPRCGRQRTIMPPLTMGGAFAPFGAQSVLLAPSKGVPEVIFEGSKAADRAEANAISLDKLEQQLLIENTADGIEDSHMGRKVFNVQVTDQHFSNMPDWNRREWIHDPFYGWRTQEESKIPLLPAVRKALDAQRESAIQIRKGHTQHLEEGVQSDASQLSLFESLRPRPLGEPRRGASSKEWKMNHGETATSIEARQRLSNAIAGHDADELGAAVKECRNANALDRPRVVEHSNVPGPSWHDAPIRERILAASHMRGNCLVQSEAVKQRAIIDYDVPVGIFVGGAPQEASGPQLDPSRTWTSVPSKPSELAGPAGSKASTAATNRSQLVLNGAKPDPYDYYHAGAQTPNRPLNVGPSLQPPPGPLWFIGM